MSVAAVARRLPRRAGRGAASVPTAARLAPHELLVGRAAGAAPAAAAGGAVGARDRDRDRRDGRRRRRVGVEPGEPAGDDRQARDEPADGDAGTTFLGANEVLPSTARGDDRPHGRRSSGCRPSTRSRRDRAAHAVRALRADRRHRRRRDRPRVAAGAQRQRRLRPVPERRQSRTSRPSCSAPRRRARSRSRASSGHIQVFLGGTWFTVIGDPEAGDARPEPRQRRRSSACLSPSGCSARSRTRRRSTCAPTSTR